MQLIDKVAPDVTHVVAAKDGTDKCLAARSIPGCVLVNASWLVECYWSMTRRDTLPHLLTTDGGAPGAKKLPQEPRNSTNETKVDSYSSEDGSNHDDADTSDDEGDFATSFEDDFMGSF